MSEVIAYDPTELITVCAAIIEDGELSGEELYDLAEWLNTHREACFHWPGNLLVQPLQDAWADGKVNKTELRLISQLLLRIRKEWAKQQRQAAAKRMNEFVAATAFNFNLQNAQLPSIPLVLEIRSHSQKGIKYQVDLSEPRCSCPDWVGARQHIPVGHLTRCCKHVLDAYGQVEPEEGWPGWLGAFFNFAWPPHPNQSWLIVEVGNSFALVSTAAKGWANAFVEVDGGYDRFGYNVEERRWSYGMAPPGSRNIARMIEAGGRV
jgi:hypothetical protein